MKLDHEFYQLPLTFDIEQLQTEIAQFDETDWVAHHESFKGNSAIALISVDGTFNNEFKGPMKPTPALDKCQYIQQVIASFGEVIGRSRLMRLAPGCEVPLHSDINYHWHKRVRIHIPITTNEDVIFHCADKQVHMARGDCWIFDSWKYHKVVNDSNEMRVHLVIDTIGSSRFWRMIREQSLVLGEGTHLPRKHLMFDTCAQPTIRTEHVNFPIIMHPSEVSALTQTLTEQIVSYQGNNADNSKAFIQLLEDFSLDWQELWSLFGEDRAGWSHYHQLRQHTLSSAAPFEPLVMVDSLTSAMKILVHLIMGPCMSTELAQQQATKNSAPPTTQAANAVNVATEQLPAGLTRNSPCPCGSGKKYKQCHGQLV
ncbi:aspartyl/asparaginyl beta-hydroxylase domain-containing protein [Shewanella colwelliana]|uniref:aspartyl/asparaginyl beta-hydroxylase domain-containing protein n=1 Tax=Shewanella colwelliana TaxID=23 RepID=UPI00299DE30E|nr:aspartyl/asparaginyl beta-hydroxylase domain-containing protein [Shewanella colwelliana]MDX1280506.1 aspartyl/asparaginyl beta-hydroxylase domain-containing protein [Shewanella colwelliana]